MPGGAIHAILTIGHHIVLVKMPFMSVRWEIRMLHRDMVVVGASAGGLEALTSLVANLPADFPATVLIVRHLAANSEGVLPSILNKRGPLPASAAVDRAPITIGHIYVAPPDHHLLVERQQL